VQDPDEPVRHPPQCVVVLDAAGAEVVVERAGSGRGVQGREGLGVQRVDEPAVVDEAGGDDFFLPDARVMGLVAA
jgi:hypothetical protein